jgi:hypothetical protein
MGRARKSKGGRPRKDGNRTKGGILSRIQAHDKGNDRVVAMREVFKVFQGGKASQQVYDPIGRAWAVGLLDNDRFDPAVLRSAARDYGERYWGHYPSTAGTANYTQESRAGCGWGDMADPRGEKFQLLDKALLDAGRQAYDAVHNIVVDYHWFPDDNPDWLGRMINERLMRAKVAVCGQLETAGDAAILARALDGLIALAEGTKRKVRALAA